MKKSIIQQHIDKYFIENKYGVFCPNCDETIDIFWPASCDHCGYPKPGYDRFDEDWDDYP